MLGLWERRALGCLQLDRHEFAAQLKERGWSYDERQHHWQRGEDAATKSLDMLLPLG
jgi:hypothetical protein